MKKLLILSIFLISGITLNAQNKQDTAKITVREVYNDAKQVLSELGSALKVGSEHVYEVLVKQQLVKSITNLVIYIVFLLVFIAIAFILNKGIKADEYGNSDGLIAMCIISTIIFLVFFIVFIFTVTETVTGFVNPEYGAINQIMELIKK